MIVRYDLGSIADGEMAAEAASVSASSNRSPWNSWKVGVATGLTIWALTRVLDSIFTPAGGK